MKLSCGSGKLRVLGGWPGGGLGAGGVVADAAVEDADEAIG
jgi:hypothetical protein